MMGARRRSSRLRGRVSSPGLQASAKSKKLSTKHRSRKQNNSTAFKKRVKQQQGTVPKRRQSSRIKHSREVTGGACKDNCEGNAAKKSLQESGVLASSAVKKRSKSTQNTSSKVTAGVYDFEFCSSDCATKMKQDLDQATARSKKRKALARSALENLRNEITQKSKRSSTKSRKVKCSPTEHGVQLFQRTSTKRRRDNTATASTETSQKKHKTVIQCPIVNLHGASDADIVASFRTESAPCSADSGVFMSPSPYSKSFKNTSTPGEGTLSTPNIILRPTEDQNESLFEEDHILAGAPDLSPVKDGEHSQININPIPVPYVEVEIPKHQHEVEEEEEDVGYRTLSISKNYSNRSFRGIFDKSPEPKPIKAKKSKKKDLGQSRSLYDAWAEKKNNEFEELDNYDLSVE